MYAKMYLWISLLRHAGKSKDKFLHTYISKNYIFFLKFFLELFYFYFFPRIIYNISKKLHIFQRILLYLRIFFPKNHLNFRQEKDKKINEFGAYTFMVKFCNYLFNRAKEKWSNIPEASNNILWCSDLGKILKIYIFSIIFFKWKKSISFFIYIFPITFFNAPPQVMHNSEHFMVTDVEWDPTGRYVATIVSWWGHKVSSVQKTRVGSV